MGKFVDLTGRTYGRLTVVRLSENKTPDNKYKYWCSCSCGKGGEVERTASLLRSGQSRSCGCLQSENAKLQANNNIGKGSQNEHKYRTTYICWRNMKARCDDENHHAYRNYGGRGISYVKKWTTFEGFLEDMGENPIGLTLNRVDVNSGYSKDNCEWVCLVKQGRDRRKPTHGLTSEYKGVSFNKKCGKYKGYINYSGVTYHLGYSTDPKELALKYDSKVFELTGSMSGTNRDLGLL